MGTSTRGRRVFATLIAGAVIVTGTLFGSSGASAAPALPTKMAALGDSLTQASMTCSALLSCPTNSWATGTSSTVNSHATRLRAAGATLTTSNLAVASSPSSALLGQARTAVGQGSQYVTIEIGANDACTKTVTSMTTKDQYRTNVKAALDVLAASSAEIFVASVPNLNRMYELNKSSLSARLAWSLFGTCQSLLANPTSTKAADVARRAAVQQRVIEYNAVLAELCVAAIKCTYDQGAVYNFAFTKSHITTRDYFHPSISGQAALAAVTWSASQWAS